MDKRQLSLWPEPNESLPDLAELLDILALWQQLQWLRPLDVGFARLIVELEQEQGREAEPLVVFLATLLSHQVGRGHVCLDLKALFNQPQATLALPPPESGWRLPKQQQPAALLQGTDLSSCVNVLKTSTVVSDGQSLTPLVLQGQRLYLRRWWRYEQDIAAAVAQRLASESELSRPTSEPSLTLAAALAVLFDNATAPQDDIDYQKMACAIAAKSPFAVITGGPGTGKTTTVVKLLAALQSIAVTHQSRPFRIRLAAPTGKAAARLNESIASAVQQLPLSELPGAPSMSLIPTQVVTLHRLLGSRPDSRYFRHHSGQPLPLDILVVDEASMVDVELMAAVMDALPANAQLILLGDKDQLASVDAGAVLGELCQRATAGHYTRQTADWLASVCQQSLPKALVCDDALPLDQAIAMLRKSYRFQQDSGIRQLAQAVNDGQLTKPLLQACRTPLFNDVLWLTDLSEPMPALLNHAINGTASAFLQGGKGRIVGDHCLSPPVGYGHYLERLRGHSLTEHSSLDEWQVLAQQLLKDFSEFQMLCAVRQGPWGVEALNEAIAERLHARGYIEASKGWYAGRPIMITANDYNLGLMNGDVGIVMNIPLPDPLPEEPAWGLRVAFPRADGESGVRWISPSRLQQLETVYAMTVHKSQGSEFNHTCLVLPDRLSPVMTKELVYTGITRAKNWFSLIAPDEHIVHQAVAQSVQRCSGLRQYLAGHTS